MTTTFNVKLEGASQLHEPVIKLEGMTVNIWSSDSGKSWKNSSVIIDVNGSLEIYFSCKAISGTIWKLSIKEAGSSDEIYQDEGETGEVLASRDGARIGNFSERVKFISNN